MSSLIEKPLQFAALKYAIKMCKGTNILCIPHPSDLALIILEENSSQEVISADLLHDTLGNTETSEEKLQSLFGKYVVSLDRADLEADKSLAWKERKRHMIADL